MEKQFQSVPEELKRVSQWITWKREERKDGKTAKIPLNPHTGRKTSPANPKSGTTFHEAYSALTQSHHAEGLGFILNGFVGVDLDHCFQDGKLTPDARRIVEQLRSYTEISPSGEGLHIIMRGSKPGTRCRVTSGNMHIEVYDSGRYFTMTGNVFEGRDTIQQVDLTAFYEAYFKEAQQELNTQLAPQQKTQASPGHTLTDSQIIERIQQDNEGRELWQGNTNGFKSHSEADYRLCCQLAFWTGKNAHQMQELFCQSGLYRPKTNEERNGQTYIERTINQAMLHTGKVYNGNGSHPSPPHPADIEEVFKPVEKPLILADLEKNREEEDRKLYQKKFASIHDIEFNIEEHHPFLQQYVKELHKCTDAKPQTLITPLLSALAANIGNKVYIQSRGRKHFCNIWSVIIAPSTIGRKTTSIRFATKPLKDYEKELRRAYNEERKHYEGLEQSEQEQRDEPSQQHIVYPSAPAEQFLSIVSKNPYGIMIYSEIADFLSKMNKSYNADFKSTITAMFDGETTNRETRSHGDEYVETPAFSIATASTKEWFLKEIDRQNDVNSGFLQRFLVCNSTEIEFNALQFDYSEGKETNQFVMNRLSMMMNELRMIGSEEEPVKLIVDEIVQQLYAHEMRETLRPYFENQETALYSYVGRLFEDYFWRFCTLFALMDWIIDGKKEPVNGIVVNEVTARRAHRLCHFYLKNIVGFLETELSGNIETKNQRIIIRLLEKQPDHIMLHKDLKNRSHLLKKDFDQAIEELTEDEFIIPVKPPSTGRGKPPTYYKLLR